MCEFSVTFIDGRSWRLSRLIHVSMCLVVCTTVSASELRCIRREQHTHSHSHTHTQTYGVGY